MPAASLHKMAQKACIKNVRSLADVGDFDYRIIRAVLQRVEVPEQLHIIELNSPQIKGEDAELWRAFIARDIPNWRTKNYVPKNPLKWYEIYCKYKKEQEQDIKRDQEALKASLLGIKKQRDANVSKVVDLKMLPKVPKDPRMMANNGGVPLSKGSGLAKSKPNLLTFTGGSKTKMKDGKSVLTRARREAREISMRNKLVTPSSQLVGNKKQIVKAPAGMVNEYRKSAGADPSLRILARKKKPVAASGTGINASSLEEREKRLRAAMGDIASATIVGSSDEESEGEEEQLDDLFDEGLQRASSIPSSVSRPSSRPLAGPSNSRPPPGDSKRPRAGLSSQQNLKAAPMSRPKPNSSQPQLSSSPQNGHRSSSPSQGIQPMMPRKRPPIDIFNRGAKKPRVGR